MISFVSRLYNILSCREHYFVGPREQLRGPGSRGRAQELVLRVHEEDKDGVGGETDAAADAEECAEGHSVR